MVKKYYFCLVIIIASLNVNAQQIPTLSQYVENNYMVNPAVAGTKSYNPISFNYKRWWSGIDDAPVVQSINTHFQLNNNIGLGGKIFNYSTGPLSKMGIEATYAYHLKLGSNGDKLSLGLSAQLYQFYLNKRLLKLEEADDNAIIYSSEKLIVPDAAFGVHYFNNNYYAGVAAYQLFNRKVDMLNDNILENRQIRHYFLNAGYILDINSNYSLEPSLLAKLIETGIRQAELHLKGVYKKLFWLRLGYRTSNTIIINAGISTDRFVFGYAYDYSLNDISKYSTGSHELLFILKFNNSKAKLE